MTADVHSLIGAYVLDAVDDIERAAFDRHLRECPACRLEVDELREASARLAEDAWSVPPPALRGSVMDAIAATRQVSPEPAAPKRQPPARLRLLSAAAAVVVAAGGAVYAVQELRVRAEHTRVESLETLLSAPDLTVHDEPVTGGGTVTVAVSRSRDAAVITLNAATAPGDGRVYQLWTIRAAKPVPEGTLTAGETTTRQIVDGIGDATDVGVSIEPSGGSTTPTMPLAAAVHL
ncbi:anti-sigma factor [Paractinoplanes toevensis]|uniref:Regulator of SigK n=1 Tax=Paractinoplanes toevensis TaxID=571911 RepID=A0A919T5R6_9ACTN|nr:anti-sigma factor [Actinoplanes toevensis]GIM88274.1 hypothetical protein Ato02nite_000670 [Actinoplanes toevensis]